MLLLGVLSHNDFEYMFYKHASQEGIILSLEGMKLKFVHYKSKINHFGWILRQYST